MTDVVEEEEEAVLVREEDGRSSRTSPLSLCRSVTVRGMFVELGLPGPSASMTGKGDRCISSQASEKGAAWISLTIHHRGVQAPIKVDCEAPLDEPVPVEPASLARPTDHEPSFEALHDELDRRSRGQVGLVVPENAQGLGGNDRVADVAGVEDEIAHSRFRGAGVR
jgi:hypothetical protein